MARIFLLKGDIANPGYVDIPEEATTIREAIYGIGGGIPNGKKFKAVQIGGPSGGLLVEEHLDLPLHFQKLKPYGVRRGDSVARLLSNGVLRAGVAPARNQCIVNGVRHLFGNGGGGRVIEIDHIGKILSLVLSECSNDYTI